ncbi:MAG: cation diffusion facilitator family transporter [Chloroflexota bacterium]|nr:cation diffusion facilitator family transporter [Chloroflexota bacterium]
MTQREYTLFHRVAEPASARIRLRVVELGLKGRIDFQNAETDGKDDLARLGESVTPALWDGHTLTIGELAVAQKLTTLAPEGDDGEQMSEGTTRAVLAAFAGNLAIAITKAIAAYVTGSGALVAETAHSIADSVNQILLYVGIRRSVQPPTEKHPLGHGKERYFWALIVALFLFFGGGVFSIYEAYERYTHPQELGAVWVGFVVLGLSMVFETFSLSVAVREVRHAAAEEGMPVRRFLQQLRDPALRTVLYEDSAALAGLVAAILGLGLTVVTGDHRFDALASAVIGLILIYVAYQLAWGARGLIVGEAPPDEVLDRLRAAIASEPGVDKVLDLRAVQMGTKQLLVLARVSVRDDIPAGDAEHLLVRLRKRLQREHPEVMDSYVELNPS